MNALRDGSAHSDGARAASVRLPSRVAAAVQLIAERASGAVPPSGPDAAAIRLQPVGRELHAHVAQVEEHPVCNRQVRGSIPRVGSTQEPNRSLEVRKGVTSPCVLPHEAGDRSAARSLPSLRGSVCVRSGSGRHHGAVVSTAMQGSAVGTNRALRAGAESGRGGVGRQLKDASRGGPRRQHGAHASSLQRERDRRRVRARRRDWPVGGLAMRVAGASRGRA